MKDTKHFVGFGFEMEILPEEEAQELTCMCFKAAAPNDPISTEQCDSTPAYAVNWFDMDGAVMCEAHFRNFAVDMVAALKHFAGKDIMEVPVQILHAPVGEDSSCITTDALPQLVSRIAFGMRTLN